MKKQLTVILIAICLTAFLQTSEAHAFKSEWIGGIVYRHSPSCQHWDPIKVYLHEDGNATLDYLNQDAFDLPATKIEFRENEFYLERATSRGARLTFQGQRVDDKITGTYLTNGKEIGRFQLLRSGSRDIDNKSNSVFEITETNTNGSLLKINLQREWVGGVIKPIEDTFYPIRIYFRNEDKELRAQYDSPATDAFDVVFDEARFGANKIELKSKTSSGKWLSFTGKINHDIITGEFSEDGEWLGIFQLIKNNRRLVKHTPVPNFEIDLLDENGAVSKKSLAGQYYLLDFWTTSCPPCVEEMPNLYHVYEKYKDRNFTIISISLDGSEEIVRRFRERKWPMPWLNAHLTGGFENQIASDFEVQGVPTMFLVSPEGIVLATEGDLVGERLERTLARYLEE